MTGYQAGDTLLRSSPFAFIIIASQRHSMCEHCWSKVPGGCQTVCGSCCLVRYCGEHCKVMGVEEHRLECSTMGQVGTARMGLNDQLRLLVRIWLKIRREGGNKEEKDGNMSKCWDDLVDHTKELLVASKEGLITQYNELTAVLKKVDMPSMDTFINIYGKILVNAFSLRSDSTFTPEHFGTGVYLKASLLNHSCAPNCTVVFTGRQLSVMATKDIPAGDIPSVAFITYVNSLEDTVTRQQQLRATWHFTCECTLCLNNELDQHKHCIKCSGCAADWPVDTVLWTLPGECPGCKMAEDMKQLARYKELYMLLTVKGEVEFDQVCELCVVQMKEVYSNSDILYIQAAHHMHLISMDNNRWSTAATYGEIALAGFKKYYGERAMLVADLLVRLGTAWRHAGEIARDAECLQEAEDIYRVVPGEESPLFRCLNNLHALG